jgi:Zn-dependent protease with chaperone function
MQHVSHATAHLFIDDPFGERKSDWLNRLFSTHPPTADRIKALMGQGAS